MDLQSFQEAMEKKTAKEKLFSLIDQIDIYGGDKANAKDAYWRRNQEESDYWQREAQGMMERILWLCHEVSEWLPDPEEDYPVCMACGQRIDSVKVLMFDHEGADHWYMTPIHYDKPTGSVSIKTSRAWTSFDDYSESYTESIRCPLCDKHPFDKEAGCEIYQPVEVVMWANGQKEDDDGQE